ncbi:hypothetical protein ACIBF5_18715 [Micromonospora sp. NPDC050417]|uniref:hypothetical protein n=1 Tax=Micromonospora sp. NPDC050417 TaxID=3364280 RepID=UPI0037978E5E
MTTPPQRVGPDRSPLSIVAIRLGLLALLSYPVFPWPPESTVDAARSGEIGRRSDPVGGGLPPRNPRPPCLTIVAPPDSAGLTVPEGQCPHRAGDRRGSSYRGGFRRDRPDVGAPDQVDTARERAGGIRPSHGPPISQWPPPTVGWFATPAP